MNLLKYEYIKIFQKKTIWVLIFSLLIVNCLLYVEGNLKNHSIYIKTKGQYENLRREYSALPPEEAMVRITKEQQKLSLFSPIDQLFNRYEDEKMAILNSEPYEKECPGIVDEYKNSRFFKHSDLLREYGVCLSTLMEQYISINTYHKFITTMGDKAKELTSSYIFNKKGSFAYRNIGKTPKDFEHLKNISLQPDIDEGVLTVSQFDLVDLCIMAILLLLCSIIFLQESESKLIILIHSTKRGRLPVTVSKLFAMISISALVAFLYYGSLLLAGSILYGYGNLSRPIQSIAEFRECNLAISVGQYLLLFFIGKAAAIILLALLFAAIFVVFSESKLIFFLIGAFLGTSFFSYQYIHPASIFSPMKYINVFSILDVYKFLGEYVNVNLFGFPVNKVPLCIGTGIITVFLCLILAGVFYVKKPTLYISLLYMKLLSVFERNHKKLRGNTSLLWHELYKVLIQNKVIWILLILIIVGYNNIDREPLLMDKDTAVYKSYVDKYGGAVTEKKEKEMEKENTFYNSISSQLTELSDEYDKGLITKNQLTSERDRLIGATGNLNGFQRFYNQYQFVKYITAEKKINGALICSISSDQLFNNYQRDYFYSILFAVALILCLSGIYYNDFKNGMFSVLRATKRGKRELFVVKYCIGIMTSIIILLLVYTPQIITFAKKYIIADWNAPVQNIMILSGLSFKISIKELMLLIGITMFIGAACMSTVIVFIAQITKRQTTAIIVSILVCILPTLAAMMKIPYIEFASFANAFTLPHSIVQNGITVNGIYLIGMLIFTSCCLFISWKKYELNR